jgi:hypothetical protein
MGQQQVHTNLPQLFLVMILGCIALLYIGPVMLTRDPLWFRPFNETPDVIIVYRDGKSLTLTPDDPRFADMTKAINRALSSIQTIDMLGPGPGVIDQYREEDTAVEVLYSQPVQLKSNQNVGKASAILIPLTGLHTERPIFYTGIRQTSGAGAPATYLAGTPVVKSWDEVRQLVDGLQF